MTKARKLHIRFEARCEHARWNGKCPSHAKGCKGWRCALYRRYQRAIRYVLGGGGK